MAEEIVKKEEEEEEGEKRQNIDPAGPTFRLVVCSLSIPNQPRARSRHRQWDDLRIDFP